MKSIKGRIIINILIILLVLSFFCGGGTIYLNYSGTMDTVKKNLSETVKVASLYMETKVETYKDNVISAGYISELSNERVPLFVKKDVIEGVCKTFGYKEGNLIDKKGRGVFDKKDYSKYDFYKKAIKGEVYISEPVQFTDKDDMKIIISAPVWEQGGESSITGVTVFVLDGKILSDAIKNIKVGETGTVYVLDSNGTVIAHPNYENVKAKENSIEDAKTDSKLSKIANIEKKMIKGKSGFDNYIYKGEKKVITYTPINNTNGWSIGVTAGRKEMMKSSRNGIYNTILITIVIMIIGIIIAIRLARKITNPIKLCVDRIEKLAQGDFKSPAPIIDSKDETAILAEATRVIVDNISTITEDAEYLLGEMRSGNFDIESNAPESYKGDFEDLRVSIEGIRDSLSSTLMQINEAADQVACGSEQVSMSSQSLAQGATEQAASINDLDSRVTMINEEIKTNAKNALAAKKQTENAGVMVTDANNQMQNMIVAMNDISKKSDEIAKIIKTIDDIAFQTNILALNAAVEAARAGSAGKGFSVVADEVRNLAGKSAEAAQNTALLIEQSVQAVSKGKNMADETGKAITMVLESAQSVVQLVNNIVISCDKQGNESDKIKEGTDQIDKVIQNNSATSEESAAAAEELNSQAVMLKELVGYFRLRANNDENGIDF